LNAAPLKIYILVFTNSKAINLAALVQYLHDSVDIAGYWNYLPLVFCVKSSLSADELSKKLQPFFRSRNYMVAQISSVNMQGSLPRGAWDWFDLERHEKVRPPALPPPTSDTLLLDPEEN